MNFIAGFLYLTLDKEEGLAFAVMREVIERYTISNLFNIELPMLKLMFYQLDRLISIHLCDLHNHFKDECFEKDGKLTLLQYLSKEFMCKFSTMNIELISFLRDAFARVCVDQLNPKMQADVGQFNC